MFFSNTHWPQLTAPFYSILFETSICQFNSSKCSPIMPDEVREHLTRDQRPFLHSCSTGFRSEDWTGHSRSLVLYSVTHFCVVFEVCVWIIFRLENPNMAHYKISNRVSHLLIFYLLVFDRIHDAMCLNKMSRTSSRNIGQKHQKNTAVYFIVHMGHFLSLCSPNPSWVFAAKKLVFLVSSDMGWYLDPEESGTDGCGDMAKI